jgi:dihydroorotate dehydrogenase electron transfer subunit
VTDLVFDARVLANDSIGGDIWILRLGVPSTDHGYHAGAFLHLKVDPGPLPFFRRAYSVLTAESAEVEVLYKVTGAGTRLLASRKAGEEMSAMGPLGNAFTPPSEGEHAVMVAGGVGLPPVLRWAEEQMASGWPAERITFIYGAQNEAELVLRPRVEALGAEVRYATDDGSFGHAGRVTELLTEEIDRAAAHGARVRYYACGPGAMLAACSAVSGNTGAAGELALETPMPCGSGVCLGCIVLCRGQDEGETVYRRTCVEGPIFPAREVMWA